MVNIIKEEIVIEEARIKYNEKQRETRKINDYFSHISDNSKNDLSVSLKDISTELSESKETIKILQESNNALELRNTNLKNENAKLKEKNKTFQK